MIAQVGQVLDITSGSCSQQPQKQLACGHIETWLTFVSKPKTCMVQETQDRLITQTSHPVARSVFSHRSNYALVPVLGKIAFAEDQVCFPALPLEGS